MEKKKKARQLRQWSQQSMSNAYQAVKVGQMTIAAAAQMFGVPRMTLADRLSGRVKLKAKPGAATYLSTDDELALCSYIDYMAKRGFPLTIANIKGFAFSIAKERGKAETFEKDGPSRKWWRGFKQRHPEFGLRRTDALDKGRAKMGNEEVAKGYFELLKTTLDDNNLLDKPQQLYNCDEAALYLNKSSQKVVVPVRQKHAHSVSVATSEHISVHCCVNAVGSAVPPMIIFSGSLPGGPYHKNGPINALYTSSESGFMNREMYVEWFQKCFIKHAVKNRPLLLIQDGASSHVSIPLLRCAIENDVILLSLSPKTTHILQPLDVAIYRKMKIETAKVMSQAKRVKSDLWVSKKTVSGIFKIIYEKSFNMNTIIEGFRKCGIYPFNPNAIDKNLLLRSSEDITANDIDLAKRKEHYEPTQTHVLDKACPTNDLAVNSSDRNLDTQELNLSDASLPEISPSDILNELSFTVGEDGILTFDQPPSQALSGRENTDNSPEMLDSTKCPPELALLTVEKALTPKKKRKYEECLSCNTNLPRDNVFKKWKSLKLEVLSQKTETPNVALQSLSAETEARVDPEKKVHPLVKAGLISPALVDILVVPSSAKTEKKKLPKARVLTSDEVLREIEEKERAKREQQEQKEKRAKERERKKVERLILQAKKKEEILRKKEDREKRKAEKEKEKQAKKGKRATEITNPTKDDWYEEDCSKKRSDGRVSPLREEKS